ncbi:MAG: ABC transporter substrate-binding protein [Nannocystaceae bacterium]|nr:ABC transporter substrate-binding protein [Nannocystaceae bacterium]
MARLPADSPKVDTARLWRLTPAAIALGLVCAPACGLTLGLDEQQPCSANSDCEYSDGQGTCVGGFCAPPSGDGPDDSATDPTTAPPGTSTGGDDDDDTTGDDQDTGTTASISDTSGNSSSDTAGLECELNTECDMDQRCGTDNTCVSLLSEECTILEYPSGDYDRDSIVFLGSIMPTGAPFDALVVPLQNAVQLAIEDFNNITTLPGNRQIAWVGCQSTAGASVAVDAARHLVDIVGAPAIIGPVFSESVIQVAEQVTVPGNTFIITPTGSAELITGLADENLVWRVTPSDVYQAEAIRDRIVDSVDPDHVRLLVLAKDDAYGSGLSSAIQAGLVAALPNAADILFLTYDNPASFKTQEELLSSYGAVLGTALAAVTNDPLQYVELEDHYTDVIILGTSEAEALIVSYIGVWAQLFSFAPMPRFVVSHGVVPSMEAIVQNLGVPKGTEALAPLRPLLFGNIEGTSPDVFDPDNFAAFNIRYKIRFMNEDALTSSSLSYDATLAAMFAMVTADPDVALTGDLIANGMAALADPQGTTISFSGAGLTFIQTARNELAAGSTVDLQGVSGALDWDPENGELRSNILGWDLAGTPDDPLLSVGRLYVLEPEPATDGTWVDL